MGKEEALDVMLKNPAVLQARLTETGWDWPRLAETAGRGEVDRLPQTLDTPRIAFVAAAQCGPSLDTLGPDEIKGFANIRGLGNKIPESARLGLISFTIGAALFPVIATLLGFEDAASVAFAKPLVGIFFSVLIEAPFFALPMVGTESHVPSVSSPPKMLFTILATEKRKAMP